MYIILYAAITCTDLPDIGNGYVAYSGTTSPHSFGAVAAYVCDAGYSLSMSGSRTCGGDGSSGSGLWSGNEPTCNSKS